MTLFLTSKQIFQATGLLMKQFDTFSSGKFLGVHKEPRKILESPDASVYAGYGASSNQSNYTYVPVSGIYSIMRVYEKAGNEQSLTALQTKTIGGTVRIKVKQNCRDFIRDGKNEYFTLEGIAYQEAFEETPQNFFGLTFYYFTLTKTT
jgi:hypothetical protein